MDHKNKANPFEPILEHMRMELAELRKCDLTPDVLAEVDEIEKAIRELESNLSNLTKLF